MILSQIMIAELLFIAQNSLRLDKARVCHQSTLKALLKRKLIYRDGRVIRATEYGEEVAYTKKLNMRKRDYDVSADVKALLHVSKILSFHKKRRAA